ncbi:MAG: F-type H+-transporting ATPase subunit delta [Actinomycetota bacterium]|jgi:F-type H+-transporting ATPase subunit delta|nr:F-type H+-transporting ATPase subunit delta [Actinomycetota bacterium]
MSKRIEGYAGGIYAFALAEDSVERVSDELHRFSNLLEHSEELRDSLGNSSLPADRRQAAVEDLLGGRASRLTTHLVSYLVGVGRIRDLPEITTALLSLVAAERQRSVAEVRSAYPLDDDQRQRLSEALGTMLGQPVDLRVIVDPSVMGGIVARVGDVVIDGTVRHRLDALASLG